MSSILKALQKLEQERTARRKGPPDVAGAILKQKKSANPPPRWLLPTGMAAVAVVAVVSTYALMGGFAQPKSGSKPSAALNSPPVAPSLPTPVPSRAAPPSVLPTQQPPVRSNSAAPTPARPAAAVKSPPSPSLPATAPRPVLPAPAPPQKQAAQAEKPIAPPASTPAKAARPALAVIGIAWQKDSATRLAVVNGISVGEGSTVEGVRVEEIFPDRVRFSFRNEKFEVPLGKSTP